MFINLMRSMRAYLTYNESPDGLYISQVIGILKFVEKEFDFSYRLIAFVSFRNFRNDKKTIKRLYVNSSVFPAFPKFRFIPFHAILLLVLFRNRISTMVCRNVLAGSIGVFYKSIVKNSTLCFDARGLVSAENYEYKIYPKHLDDFLDKMEIKLLKRSDKVSVITNEMLEYWCEYYNVDATNKSTIIPCTLNENEKSLKQTRIELTSEFVWLSYVGSTAPWQSFDALVAWLTKMMSEYQDIAVIFLTKSNPLVDDLQNKFGKRVLNLYVEQSEVSSILKQADYGLLLRESSITNSVSSPTKFAEYLDAGLPVITNRNLAIHDFVLRNNVGIVIEDFEIVGHSIPRSAISIRENCIKCASRFKKDDNGIKARLKKFYA